MYTVLFTCERKTNVARHVFGSHLVYVRQMRALCIDPSSSYRATDSARRRSFSTRSANNNINWFKCNFWIPGFANLFKYRCHDLISTRITVKINYSKSIREESTERNVTVIICNLFARSPELGQRKLVKCSVWVAYAHSSEITSIWSLNRICATNPAHLLVRTRFCKHQKHCID